MDLLSDPEDKFNEDLNELVKETYDKEYQDEVKMYTDVLAYYTTKEQPSTSITRRCKRYKKLPAKISKKTEKSDRNSKNVLINDDAEEMPTELKELNKKLNGRRYSHSIHKIESYKKVDPPRMPSKSIHRSFSSVKDVDVNTSDSEPKYVEKMTYCRPVLNMFNQDFVYRTMERNIRLQELVKRLVETRAKEKHHEAWNNYINDLRNKHRYQPDLHKLHNNVPEDSNPDIIDYYNTKFLWKQSNPCQNLLDDFYSSASKLNNNVDDDPNYRYYNFNNDSHCFPTSSQGRIMMTIKSQKEMPEPQRYYGRNKIVIERDHDPYVSKLQRKGSVVKYVKKVGVQTDSDLVKSNVNIREHAKYKEKINLIQSNVDRLKQKIIGNEPKKASLSNIENKLDKLIETVNTFMSELKVKRVTSERSAGRSIHSVADQSTEKDVKRVNYLTNDIMCGVVHEKHHGFLTKDSIDKILYEEKNKSDKVKRDIEELLLNPQNPCSVKIMFDIPTKERSTEVTDSIYTVVNNRQFAVEEVCKCRPDADRMTIAVNTEPLGILALIRISTDTVKHLLSYMPDIDYYSYLSRLQCSLAEQRPRLPTFDCNICGATFERASQLSDHIIQQHNLAGTRDCCVCRHVIDLKPAGLFKCRHCGQLFTRAYCRELHEVECGRKLGRPHDVSPSLIFLS